MMSERIRRAYLARQECAFRRQRFGSFSSCCVAWPGHESCCCSGVSKALRQKHVLQRFATVFVLLAFECFRTAPPVPGHESCCCSGVSRALRQKHVLQRFATVFVLLAFECFRTAPPVRDCANGFGIKTMPRRLCLAGYRVPDKRINVFYGFQR